MSSGATISSGFIRRRGGGGVLPSGNVEDVGGAGGGARSSRGEVAAEVELYLGDRRSAGIWIYLVSPFLPP